MRLPTLPLRAGGLFAALVALALACEPTAPLESPAAPADLGQVESALGEPNGSYPEYNERALLFLTNRARLAPDKATDIGCPRNFSVPAKPPVEFNLTLSWSSRFHSKTYVKAPCFQHDSCCYIQGTGLNAYCCDVTSGANCSASVEKYSCSNCGGGQKCGGTTFADRIQKSFGYAGQGFGENIAVGYATARDAFCAFYDEGPDANDGIEHGHFLNIMSEPDRFGNPTPVWNEMGGGFFNGNGCSTGGGTLPGKGYTQDFGLRSTVVKSAIPSALHRPEFGTSVTVGAIWNGAAPKLISAVVDGVCTPLAQKAGSTTLGAWVYEAPVAISAGCHRYFIYAVDSAGKVVTYPDTGSLQVGDKAGACTSDYTTSRLSAACCTAGVACPNSASCNSGTCGTTCVPGGSCTSADGCQTGTTTCTNGTATCGNLTPVANGASCGVDLVCYQGACTSCAAGKPCPDPAAPTNPCRAGTTTCTGTSTSPPPICSNVAALPNGTACGSAKSCYNGNCINCAPGAACDDPTNPCKEGTTSCTTGSAVCTNLANKAEGTPCGTGTACYGGACIACNQGAPCEDPLEPCRYGTTDCATGTAVCGSWQTFPDGTECDVGKYCATGVCSACNAGDRCTSPTDPCMQGSIDCSTGKPVCTGLAQAPDGVACGSGSVCKTGVCVACASGAPCQGTNPCKIGALDCSTGSTVCTNFVNSTNGSSCGTGKTCFNGTCLNCDAGAPCDPVPSQPEPCKKGTTDCSTGAPVCQNLQNVPNGTTCGSGLYCVNGSCASCNEGAGCAPPDGNVCHTATLSCATGTATCSNISDKPNGTSCGTNKVCSAGTCVGCTTGLNCTSANGCASGTTSCTTGTQTCANLTLSPNGTVCGTGMVCNAGQCVSCTDGALCFANDGCEQGYIDCSSGSAVCVIAATRSTGSSCGQNKVCTSTGSCVSCTANKACNPNSNICLQSKTTCTSGSEVCPTTGATQLPNGTSCGTGKVCNNGTCTLCASGVACSNPSNACEEGTTSCATGTSQCTSFQNKPNGTSCGTKQVCNAGTCVSCDQGAPCTDPSNPCRTGTIDCASGSAVCANIANARDGTSCGTNVVCSGGVCTSCQQGAQCPPSNPCKVGAFDCSSGTPVCNATSTNVADGTTCGRDQVCKAGVCTGCVAGAACAHPTDKCQVGTTSCATGTAVCGSFTAAPDGTGCGTNQVCKAGVCTGCTAGAACAHPTDPCQKGTTSCSTGTAVCGNFQIVPDNTSCGPNMLCFSGTCYEAGPDAGAGPDASAADGSVVVVRPDAGLDAGPDAAAPGPDAAAPGADAAAPGPDAGTSVTPADASTAEEPPDASGELPPDTGADTGCGCSSSGVEGAMWGLMGALTLLRRRRR